MVLIFLLIYLLSIAFILLVSTRVFIKAGRPWWALFVPYYNLYCMFDMSCVNPAVGLAMFIAISVLATLSMLFANVTTLVLIFGILCIVACVAFVVYDVRAAYRLYRIFGMSKGLAILFLFIPIGEILIAFSNKYQYDPSIYS